MKEPDRAARTLLRMWVNGIIDCNNPEFPLNEKTKKVIHDSMHQAMVKAIVKCSCSGDGSFFREFAKAIENQDRLSERARIWLLQKHSWPHYRDGKRIGRLRFTREELLQESYDLGLTTESGEPLDPKQLDRFMNKCGYSYKNSRKRHFRK